MSTVVDPDARQAASHRNMLDHLTAPLQAGAREEELAISSAGKATLTRTTRYPLLLAAPADAVAELPLILTATVPGAAAATTAQVVLRFEPYTEAGAYLPLWWPDFDPAAAQQAAFEVSLKLRRGTQQVVLAQIAGAIALRLIEGLTGQLLYLL